MLYLLFLAFFCSATMHFTRPEPRKIRISAEDMDSLHELRRLGLQTTDTPSAFIIDEHDLHAISHVKYSVTDESTIEGYPTHEEMISGLKALTQRDNRFSYRSIGASHGGRELGVLSYYGGGDLENPPLVRLIGNIHGDEVVGRELLVSFAEHLETEDAISGVLKDVRIEILPSMNPDGFAANKRNTTLNKDPNRSFPDKFDGALPVGEVPIEVTNVMNWLATDEMALVANFHGGEVVCNYPRDGNSIHENHVCESTPDTALHKHICHSYANYNYQMSTSLLFRDGGIVCGGWWYILYGGLQDYVYDTYGIPSVTIEVSKTKTPEFSKIQSKYVPENIGSLIHFTMKGKQGVSIDIEGGHTATVDAGVGSSWTCKGKCFRVLEPADYVLHFTSTSGTTQASITVEADAPTKIHVQI